MLFNSLRLRQNGRHFADNVFKCIFLNENVWISLKISMKFVPKGLINNISPLVQIMAFENIVCEMAAMTSHYLNQWWLVYWHIYALLGLDELINLYTPKKIMNNFRLISYQHFNGLTFTKDSLFLSKSNGMTELFTKRLICCAHRDLLELQIYSFYVWSISRCNMNTLVL